MSTCCRVVLQSYTLRFQSNFVPSFRWMTIDVDSREKRVAKQREDINYNSQMETRACITQAQGIERYKDSQGATYRQSEHILRPHNMKSTSNSTPRRRPLVGRRSLCTVCLSLVGGRFETSLPSISMLRIESF